MSSYFNLTILIDEKKCMWILRKINICVMINYYLHFPQIKKPLEFMLYFLSIRMR